MSTRPEAIITTPPSAVSATPPRVAALLASLRAAHAAVAPHAAHAADAASLQATLRTAAATARSWPSHAPEILAALTPLLTHADAPTAGLAASACLEFLDVAAALPLPIIDELLPSLAALLEHSVGTWSWQLSMYRFARFPTLRRRVIEAALRCALAPTREGSQAATAALQLEDVVVGLQRANAFDEPRVIEAFSAFVIGDASEDVRRATLASLLAIAPHVVAPALERNPVLFPSVETLHHFQDETRDHLVGLTVHALRAEGLGTAAPLALTEATIADRSSLGLRMAAALAAPAAARAHPEARERLTALVRMLLDDDRAHRARVEGQQESFAPSTIAVPPLLALAQGLPEERRRAIALDALGALARGPRTSFALVAMARLCDPRKAAQLLAGVACDATSAPLVRFAAVDAVCVLAHAALAGPALSGPALASLARAACAALAACLGATDASTALVEVALQKLPALAGSNRQDELAPLVDAWAKAALARADVTASLRFASLEAMREEVARARWLEGALDVARGTLRAAGAHDAELARLCAAVVL